MCTAPWGQMCTHPPYLPNLFQDLRLEEDFQSCVWFQPSLSPNPVGSAAALQPVAAAVTVGGGPEQPADPKTTALPLASSMTLLVRKTRVPELLLQRPMHIMSIASTPTAMHAPHHVAVHHHDHHHQDPHHKPHLDHQSHQSHQARAQPHDRHSPSMLLYSSTITEVWDTAQHLVEKLDDDASVQVRLESVRLECGCQSGCR